MTQQVYVISQNILMKQIIVKTFKFISYTDVIIIVYSKII